MTVMLTEPLPSSRRRKIMSATPDSADVTAEEASRGYVRLPSSLLKLLFGLVALLSIVVVITLGLLWSEHSTFSRESDNKDQRITNLGTRVNQQSVQVNELQRQIDNLSARIK